MDSHMNLDLESSLERCCRLCAEEQDVTLKIFSQEAEAMLLHNKLNKYLLIEVDEDDKLPKNICIKCCTKLQTVCEFIDTAQKAQDVLHDRSLKLEQMLLEQKALNVKKELTSDDDDDAKITKMEVNVDPMVVLQNLGQLLSPSPIVEERIQTNINGVTFIGGADGENVTLQLISKSTANSPIQSSVEITDEPKSVEKTDDKNSTDLETKNVFAKPFPCLTCRRGFYTELALKNHNWIHSNEEVFTRNFQCNSCSLSFEFKSDLIGHMKLHRVQGTCEVCGRCFRSDHTLKAHMKIHQSPGKSHSCKVCGRSYNTKSNLKTHSVTHSNERPYKCHFCKKCFKRNQDLKFHLNQHTGAKPFKCPFCDKSFASSGNCYSHRSRMHPGRRVETKLRRRTLPTRDPLFQPRTTIVTKTNYPTVKGIYKYQCQICNNTFMKRENFTYHMYQHTGEKPFHCSFCPEKFITRRGLLIHHDKMHPKSERPLALISKNLLLK